MYESCSSCEDVAHYNVELEQEIDKLKKMLSHAVGLIDCKDDRGYILCKCKTCLFIDEYKEYLRSQDE